MGENLNFSLEKYLSQEEQSTAALTLYTKKQFFQGIHEVVESSNEENLKRIEKYKVAVDGLQKNLEDSMAKAKEFKQKYEHLLSKKETVESRKSRLGVGNSISAISNMAGNYAPIINTVCQLQKERK